MGQDQLETLMLRYTITGDRVGIIITTDESGIILSIESSLDQFKGQHIAALQTWVESAYQYMGIFDLGNGRFLVDGKEAPKSTIRYKSNNIKLSLDEKRQRLLNMINEAQQ